MTPLAPRLVDTFYEATHLCHSVLSSTPTHLAISTATYRALWRNTIDSSYTIHRFNTGYGPLHVTIDDTLPTGAFSLRNQDGVTFADGVAWKE